MTSASDYLLFIGADPALAGDYFGIGIHALPKKMPIGRPWMPFLLRLFKMHAENYKTMWNELNEGILKPYKNFYKLQIDYTTEKTIADFLEDKYGENRITKTPFTKGESGSKMRIAKSSLHFLTSGYQFPDHNLITDPYEKENIRMLKQQIVNEELIINADGSVKFKHKGPHNDLLHGWQLSLDECLKYILSKQGSSVNHVGTQMRDTPEINYGIRNY